MCKTLEDSVEQLGMQAGQIQDPSCSSLQCSRHSAAAEGLSLLPVPSLAQRPLGIVLSGLMQGAGPIDQLDQLELSLPPPLLGPERTKTNHALADNFRKERALIGMQHVPLTT